MTTLTIRNLPTDVIQRLKERAKKHGRSMEQEARDILGQRLASRDDILEEMRALWPEMKSHPSASEVDAWIEAGRRGRA